MLGWSYHVWYWAHLSLFGVWLIIIYLVLVSFRSVSAFLVFGSCTVLVVGLELGLMLPGLAVILVCWFWVHPIVLWYLADPTVCVLFGSSCHGWF